MFPKPQRKPLGPPLPRSDEDLDRLSQITPEDIEAAKAAVSGTVIGRILDAQFEEDREEDADQS